jgi:hypothetical protein
MLLALLTWAYAHQVMSSRRVEELCRTDVAFRVICAGDVPGHCTISRFRGDFPGLVETFFAGVLMLCARLGMGKLGMVALDGTKIAASASKEANRTEEHLRKLAAGAVAAHAAAGAAEDELFGAGARGDEVPPDAWRPGSRRQRIAAALADLEAERAAAAAKRGELALAHLEPARAGSPRSGARPPETEVAVAQLNLDRATAAQQAKINDWQARNAALLAAGGRPLRNPPRAPASQYVRVKAAAARLERAAGRAAAARRKAAEKAAAGNGPRPVRNITDPASRLMPVRGGGFIQGYNAQNVTSEDGLIIATRLTNDTTDTRWYEPMTGDACAAAALITANQPARPAGPGDAADHGAAASDRDDQDGEAGSGSHDDGCGIGLVLADAGYLSLDNLKASGPGRLIATGKRRTLEKAARQAAGDQEPGQEEPGDALITAMTARLATEKSITAYRQRGHIAETPHGNIKHNKRFRQLSVRGKPKAAAEWTFAATVHNLFKAITSGHLTTETLTALTS